MSLNVKPYLASNRAKCRSPVPLLDAGVAGRIGPPNDEDGLTDGVPREHLDGVRDALLLVERRGSAIEVVYL